MKSECAFRELEWELGLEVMMALESESNESDNGGRESKMEFFCFSSSYAFGF